MASTREHDPLSAFTFDEDGFLKTPELWSRDLALGIAAELGVRELSEEHWEVVDRLREQYFATGDTAPPASLCRELGLGAHCLERLFGGLVEALRVAGLPCTGDQAAGLPDRPRSRGRLDH